jgi:hypothetical protein
VNAPGNLPANGKHSFTNKALSSSRRTGPPTGAVPKVTKMHQFGHQRREIAAIESIVVFDHDVTAIVPLNIS